jgi:hypothetical protein
LSFPLPSLAAATAAAIALYFIIIAVAFIVAISVTIAPAAFSWLLFVVFSPAIAVSTGVFIDNAAAAALPQMPLSL